MKKCFWVISFLTLISLLGCRSIDTRKTDLERIELEKMEVWRKNLPEVGSAVEPPIFPKVSKQTLENGLTILVVEDHRLPIVHLSLAVKGGSARDPEGYAGLNHLTALMLKEGTKHKTSLELAEDFANLGTEVSVTTTKDLTQISAAVLANKAADVITMMASMAIEPRFDVEDFSRLKKLQESVLASEQGVFAYVAQTNFLKAAYGAKHPYGHPSAGTLDSLPHIKLSDIKKAHKANFGANVTALIAVGDVNLKELTLLAKKHFGRWKKIAHPNVIVANPVLHKEMQTLLVERPSSPQTYLLMGQPVASHSDPALPALDVLKIILAGLPTSRLNENLREAKGWTYGVASQITPLLGKGPLFVSTSVQVPYGADAMEQILMEFQRLKTSPISDQELLASKNGLLYSFSNRYSTVAKIAHAVTQQFAYSLPSDYDETLFHNIAKVTKEDLMSVANKALQKEHMIAVAVGDLEAIEPPLKKMDMGKVVVEKQ